MLPAALSKGRQPKIETRKQHNTAGSYFASSPKNKGLQKCIKPLMNWKYSSQAIQNKNFLKFLTDHKKILATHCQNVMGIKKV